MRGRGDGRRGGKKRTGWECHCLWWPDRVQEWRRLLCWWLVETIFDPVYWTKSWKMQWSKQRSSSLLVFVLWCWFRALRLLPGTRSCAAYTSVDPLHHPRQTGEEAMFRVRMFPRWSLVLTPTVKDQAARITVKLLDLYKTRTLKTRGWLRESCCHSISFTKKQMRSPTTTKPSTPLQYCEGLYTQQVFWPLKRWGSQTLWTLTSVSDEGQTDWSKTTSQSVLQLQLSLFFYSLYFLLTFDLPVIYLLQSEIFSTDVVSRWGVSTFHHLCLKLLQNLFFWGYKIWIQCHLD